MDHQTAIQAQEAPATTEREIPEDGLEARLTRLETAVAELQAAVQKLTAPSEGPAFRLFHQIPEGDEAYNWVEPPAHLRGVTNYSQLEPEDLVYIHELTDEDVRLRLEQLERWYGMSSEEFYQRWQQGEVDDDVYLHKIEWSTLYEDWLQNRTRSDPREESE